MKHTQKRAILAAIAMLVVSAVALSSATFAWFSAGDSVNVADVGASVSNSTGSILISKNNADWVTSLTATDLATVGTNLLPTQLIPVSVTPSTSGAQVVAANIEDGVFTATGLASGGFIKYVVYVKATVDCTATVTPTFAAGAAGTFCYGMVEHSASTLVLNPAARTYYPIEDDALTCSDNNPANDIVDAAESATGLGDVVTSVATGNISLTLTADVSQLLTIYVWAEGQDSTCRGAIPSTNTSISLLITKV